MITVCVDTETRKTLDAICDISGVGVEVAFADLIRCGAKIELVSMPEPEVLISTEVNFQDLVDRSGVEKVADWLSYNESCTSALYKDSERHLFLNFGAGQPFCLIEYADDGQIKSRSQRQSNTLEYLTEGRCQCANCSLARLSS